MKPSKFAKIVVEMIQCEKETFQELIENEDWQTLEDEINEYANNATE